MTVIFCECIRYIHSQKSTRELWTVLTSLCGYCRTHFQSKGKKNNRKNDTSAEVEITELQITWLKCLWYCSFRPCDDWLNCTLYSRKLLLAPSPWFFCNLQYREKADNLIFRLLAFWYIVLIMFLPYKPKKQKGKKKQKGLYQT